MLYIIFFIYFLALAYFITKIKFLQKTALSTTFILFLFILKIAAGVVGGLVNHYIYNDNADACYYTYQSIVEYNNLISHPFIFFTDSLPSAYSNGIDGFFSTTNSFWNDLRNNILIKTMGVLNIFSKGNYYINSLFFNFIAFVGHIALYRVFKTIYPSQKWSIIIGCFLLPSMLYYSSIIGKDMIVFTALSFFCYCMFFGLQNKFTKKRITYLFLSFIIILLIRNFIAIILLLCAIGWFVSVRFNVKPSKLFISFLVLTFALILFSTFLPEKYKPLQLVVNRQQSFFALGFAKSQFQNDTLQPTVQSFIKSAPAALRHSFLSPYPTEFDNIYLNFFAIEIILFLLLFVISIIYPLKNFNNNFIIFGILFTSLIFLFTGYITTNAGSMVRYRSIYFPFLIVPILCSINWINIKNLLIKKIKNNY